MLDLITMFLKMLVMKWHTFKKCDTYQHLSREVFSPLPGATSENVRAGPRAERPKTSGRDR